MTLFAHGSHSSSPASGVLIAFAKAKRDKLTVMFSEDIREGEGGMEKTKQKEEEEGKKEKKSKRAPYEPNFFFFFLRAF
jgi:hypothetical protein